jgi:ParB/RepB/Spo0J family partition protein
MKETQPQLLNVADIVPSQLVKQDRDRSTLANSVKHHGVLQNIMVRPHPKRRGKYEIVFGRGRWEEAKRSGQKRISAITRQCNDKELLLYNAIENFSRSNLSEIQEGEILKDLHDQGFSTRALERELGISDSQIVQRIKLVEVLPDKAKRAIESHRVAPSIFEYVTGTVKDHEMQAKVIEAVVDRQLDLDSTMQLVRGIEPTDQVYKNSEPFRDRNNSPISAAEPKTMTFLIELQRGVVVKDGHGSILVRDSKGHRERNLAEELQKAWSRLQPGDTVTMNFKHTMKTPASNGSTPTVEDSKAVVSAELSQK